MRIAYVHPPFETVPTASEKSSASLIIWQNEIATRLAGKHKQVIYAKGDAAHEGRRIDSGIEYRYIPSRLVNIERRITNGLTRVEQFLNYPNPKRPIVSSSWYYPLYIRRIATELSHEPWDVIHITQFSQFAPVIRKHNPDAKLVLMMHSPWLGLFDREAIRPALEELDCIFVVSQFLAQGIYRNFPDLRDRVTIIYNGIDVQKFVLSKAERASEKAADKSEPQHILYTGRVSPEKGVHVLIDAFIRLADRFPNAVLDIVGTRMSAGHQFIIPMDDDPLVQDLNRFYKGPWRKDNYMVELMRRIPAHLKLRIRFVGPQPQDHLRQYFRKASVCVFPSVVQEAFSLALVEGMASGVPVICTKSGGGAEIMENGVTGLLVSRGSAEELAKAIATLLENPVLRQQYGSVAQEKVRGLFTWGDTARLIEEQYHHLTRPPKVALPHEHAGD